VKLTSSALPTGATVSACQQGATTNGFSITSTCTVTFDWTPTEEMMHTVYFISRNDQFVDSASKQINFIVEAGKPVISSISPTLVPTVGNEWIYITGLSFGSAPDVEQDSILIDGNECWNHPSITQGTLKCKVDKGQCNPVPVVIKFDGGSTSDPYYIGYLPPTIETIEPTSGDSAGGYQVTIIGTVI
jgi:hypothetical protein